MSLPPNDLSPPFYVTPAEELDLRIRANQLVPAPVVSSATSFDDFVRQLMIPASVMELARKASNIRFAGWETEAIGHSIKSGILGHILKEKAKEDTSHPPYIRVACTGKGDYDDVVSTIHPELSVSSHEHHGDFGSPTVLEIWPAGHYSPIHSHGTTTGIIHCLTGQIDVMAYETLDWNAKKLGLLTLTAGQCAWLTDKQFAVHKVYCPMSKGTFAATFHVYLNKEELPLLKTDMQSENRDAFDFIDETTHEHGMFKTYSDLSWKVLRSEMAWYAAKTSLMTAQAMAAERV